MSALGHSGFEDLFSRDIVAGYLDSPRFVRRDWLEAELEQRLASSSTRIVLLVGEPGSGKSGAIAQLAADHPRWPAVFLRRDQRLPADRGGVRSFLLRVGLQLAAAWPELFDSDQVRIEVTQRIGELADGGEAVGAEVGRILASPFHQTVIDVQQQVRRARGSVAGVRVREWVMDPRRLDVADLENMALSDPARALLRSDPEQRIVVLLDALDELLDDADDQLFSWLAGLPDVPDNVRLVVASRPASRLSLIAERQAGRCERVDIDTSDTRVRDDLVQYASELVTSLALPSVAEDQDRDALVAALVNTADGNIGYLDALGRSLDATPQGTEDVAALLRQERLPEGLTGLYAFFLHRVRDAVGDRSTRVDDPESGRSVIVELWSELYRPILEVLCVTRAALDADTLVALTGTLAGGPAVVEALNRLSQFLDRVGNRYRLYHATVAEFMTSSETRSSAQTVDLFVDGLTAHRRVSLRLGRDFDQLWVDVEDPVEQSRRAYARAHYVAHLAAGREFTKLFETVDDQSFGREKLRADPSAALLYEDLDLAIAATVAPGLVDESVSLLPALYRYRLLQHSLRTTADRHSLEAYFARALIGRADEAIGLAELISSAAQRGRSLSAILSGLAHSDAPATDQAMMAATRAAQATSVTADAGQALPAVESLLGAWLAWLEHDDALVDTAVTAIRQLAGEQFAPETRAAVLRALGTHVKGHGSVALALIDELRDLHTDAHDDPDIVAQNWSALAAEVGRVDDARAALDAITDPFTRALASLPLVRALIDARRSTEARSLLGHAEVQWREGGPNGIVSAAPDFADAWRSLGEEEAAYSCIELGLGVLASDDWPIPAAAELARWLKERGSNHSSSLGIEAIRRRAVDDLERSRPPGLFGIVAPSACVALADIDEPDVAAELARRINPSQALAPWQAVAESYARTHRWSEAMSAVQAIEQIESLRLPFQVSVQQRPVGGRRDRPAGSGSQGARAYIAIKMAEDDWLGAVALVESITTSPACDVALASLAIARANEDTAQAADLLARHDRYIRLQLPAVGREENVVACLSLLVAAQQWEPAIALQKDLAGDTGTTRARLIELLVDGGGFERARSIISELPDIQQPDALVQWAQRRFATDADEALDALRRARAMSQTLAPDDAWRQLQRIAHALAEIGQLADAQTTLDEAIAAWGKVPTLSFRPSPYARLGADRVRVGQPDEAVRFLRRFPPQLLFDRVAGFVFTADAFLERGARDRAIECLDEACESVEQVETPPWRQDMQQRIAESYARAGVPEKAADPRLALGPESERSARGAVARDLVEAGQALEALAFLDRPDDTISDDLRARAAQELVARHEVNRARELIDSIEQAQTRLTSLADLSLHLADVGENDSALQTAQAAFALLPAVDPARVSGAAAQLARALWQVCSAEAYLKVVQDEWASADSARELGARLALAQPLVTAQGELAVALSTSISWVAQFFADL